MTTGDSRFVLNADRNEITHAITFCQFPSCSRLFASRFRRVPADGSVPLCSTVIGGTHYSSICPPCRDEHESMLANKGRRDPLPSAIVTSGPLRRLVASLAGIVRHILPL